MNTMQLIEGDLASFQVRLDTPCWQAKSGIVNLSGSPTLPTTDAPMPTR